MMHKNPAKFSVGGYITFWEYRYGGILTKYRIVREKHVKYNTPLEALGRFRDYVV